MKAAVQGPPHKRQGGDGGRAGEGGRAGVLAALERLTKHPALHWLPTLRRIGADNLRTLEADWDTWALPGQRVAGDWRVWLIRAGRGFGKTRAGAEWISEIARTTPDARIALVGATASEARQVMVEGESGLLACKRHGEATCWKRDQGLLLFGSGAQAQVFSAEAPESLRGAQHHVAWCDEIAKWRYGEAAWDNLMLGLRLGTHPRVVVTTTPRPNNLMRRIMTTKGVTLTTGRTRDNFHLPAVFVEAMEDAYGGTAKGRQELDGEMIEEADGALWSRALIERARVDGHPELARIVVGVDPPATAEGDACGIVCVGLGADGRGYVLEDASVGGLTPEGWAAAVASCAERWGADRVVAETNQGGEMVASVLRGADRALPVKPVHASRSKTARAEPVMTWYASGRVFHAGRFPALEDELCGLRVGGAYEGPGRSPDRADACVWALTELLGKPAAAPAVRTL